LDLFSIVTQGVGFLAFATGIYAFTHQNDRHLKLSMTGQNLLLSIHFFMLGAYTGGVAAAINIVRYYLSIYSIGRKFAPLFIVLYIGLGLYLYQEPKDVLAIVSAVIATCAVFYAHGMKMRILLSLCTFLWLVHNVMAMSIGPSLMEVMILLSNGRTMWYIRREQKSVKARERAIEHEE